MTRLLTIAYWLCAIAIVLLLFGVGLASAPWLWVKRMGREWYR